MTWSGLCAKKDHSQIWGRDCNDGESGSRESSQEAVAVLWVGGDTGLDWGSGRGGEKCVEFKMEFEGRTNRTCQKIG